MVKFIILDFYNVLYFAAEDKLNDQIFEFIKQNSREYKFGVLSAVNSDLTSWFKERKINNEFVFIKTTAELGVSKTDPDIYEMVVNGLEFRPNQVLLIDDSKENLLAANEAGLKTMQYFKTKPFNEQISTYLMP